MAELPHITTTDTVLQIDSDAFVFEEITGVGYLRITTRASGVVTNLTRRFVIEAPGRRRTLNLDGAKVEAGAREDLWRQLVEVSHVRIEPRLRAEALARIVEDRQPVTIGRLELGPTGFAWQGRLRTRQFAWPQLRRAAFRSAQIRIVVDEPAGSGREKTVASLGTETPNAVLLPALMSECAQSLAG